MRTVLLVAFHFPPLVGSSGVQRTLRFAQYLPEFGWKPIVLTLRDSAYPAVDKHSLSQVSECTVVRTPCLDAARHLSLGGRYPSIAAIPDRWASWKWFAVRAGLRACREHKVDALWSTYPIATAHAIGASLAKRSSLPWIADFRDPMAQDGYPADPRRWRAFVKIEKRAMSRAARLVFVSPSAAALYRRRYPATPADRFELLENGFDESSFEGLSPPEPEPNRTPLILHSGIVYPTERDPRALFTALAQLVSAGRIAPGDFVIRFRAPAHVGLLRELIAKHDLQAYVQIEPSIPYRNALGEMLSADALLIMQGESCNEQIPAKLYEYLRAQRPILGLADPKGDTGQTLKGLGYPYVTPLESVDGIARTFPMFLQALRASALPVARREIVDRYSRRALTGRLARILDTAVEEARACTSPVAAREVGRLRDC